MRKEVDYEMAQAFSRYVRRMGEYSDDAMCLGEWKYLAEKVVSYRLS